jgi:4-aminobutyrate aminotransferase-like enzyme
VSEQKPTNAEIAAKYRTYMFPSSATYYAEPVALESGSGSRLRDFDGKTYLDFFGGILTVGVGHCNERVNAAVRAQIERLGHVSTLYPNLPMVELAERLVRLAPGKLEKVFFCASGTEADETAVALARAHTGRAEVIALRHGYSGRSALGQALTGNSRYRLLPTQVAGVKHAHAPYCYRCPFGLAYPSCELRCARDIADLIETTTTGEVAGILLEPILGVGGVIVPPPGWMALAVEIVKKYGGIFICDEVQTGFGRTGTMWGVDAEGVAPDIVTMAKAIANGYPLSAVVTTAAIADAWTAGNISTFGANPVSCAAATATLDVVSGQRLAENAAEMGRLMRAGLDRLKDKYAPIGEVRGRGLMVGIELVRDERTGDRTPDTESTARVFEETRRRGLLVGRGGLYGNVLRIAPPLVVTRSEVDEALAILDESLSAVA